MANEAIMHEMALALKGYRLELEDTKRQLEMVEAVRERLDEEVTKLNAKITTIGCSSSEDTIRTLVLDVPVTSLVEGDTIAATRTIGEKGYLFSLKVVSFHVLDGGKKDA